jgi:hypothetical protein
MMRDLGRNGDEISIFGSTYWRTLRISAGKCGWCFQPDRESKHIVDRF